jgi:hypothetical protein
MARVLFPCRYSPTRLQNALWQSPSPTAQIRGDAHVHGSCNQQQNRLIRNSLRHEETKFEPADTAGSGIARTKNLNFSFGCTPRLQEPPRAHPTLSAFSLVSIHSCPARYSSLIPLLSPSLHLCPPSHERNEGSPGSAAHPVDQLHRQAQRPQYASISPSSFPFSPTLSNPPYRSCSPFSSARLTHTVRNP